MALVSIQEISLAYGGPLIFDKMSLQLDPKERVALLGRNGAGKTTLMKVIAGIEKVNDGQIMYQKNAHVAYLAQEVPSSIEGTVFDVVLSGLGENVGLLKDYHHLLHRLETDTSQKLMNQLGTLQSEIDINNGWVLNNQVEDAIAQMKLDGNSDFQTLSGGKKRRALLALALVAKPDVLLLDEPTNHLDIDSITWLEEFIKSYPGTILFVTHDRTFMQHVATRIIELDQGKIYSWECDYKTFLERKQAALESELTQDKKFNKKLAQEEVWIRKGIKARRCRNEGRVRALEKMREEKKKQRKELGLVKMKTQDTGLSGNLVINAKNIGFSYDENSIIKDFTTQIMRGDKIGVIGPNGCGKTTLLRILLGDLAPNNGTIKLGTNLQIAYYDQLREQLDEQKTVAENIAGESETIIINDKPRHIIGYLQDFLFSPDRARTPIRVLSGGERNRLLLAKLFTKPANLLVMDEPTNDLDIETLELLEELLLEYNGTLLLVSHDRTFLNNVVTSTIVLEGDGIIKEYAGGYDDWLNQRSTTVVEEIKPKEKKKVIKQNDDESSRKRTFKEEKEFEGLMGIIKKLEQEEQEIFTLLGDPAFYTQDPEKFAQTKQRVESIKEEILKLYERWEFLDSLDPRQ